MRYSESYTNVGLSVISPESEKFTAQNIDGGNHCAIAILPAEKVILPDRSQESSEMLSLDSLWRSSRNQERFVRTDRLTVVLMAGLPCTGKTTLAYGLQDKLGWRVIDKDWYKEKLLERGVDDDSASRRAYNQSFEEMGAALKDLHTPVILDSAALHQFILDEAMKIVSHVPNALIKVILCVASRDLRVERLYTRSHPHPHPKVDTTDDVSDFHHFGHLPKGKDELLVIDTKEPPAECLDKAKEFVLS